LLSADAFKSVMLPCHITHADSERCESHSTVHSVCFPSSVSKAAEELRSLDKALFTELYLQQPISLPYQDCIRSTEAAVMKWCSERNPLFGRPRALIRLCETSAAKGYYLSPNAGGSGVVRGHITELENTKARRQTLPS